MKILLLSFFCLSLGLNTFSQNIASQELLDKAIRYHDPNGAWNTFDSHLNVTMETTTNSNRNSEVYINIPKETFQLITKRDSTTIIYKQHKGDCIISMSDSIRISKQTEKPRRSHCDMTSLYKNYYSYLYGLPMKLKDPGTILSNKVEHKTFNNKDYLVLKVNYEVEVGSDIWYFYFNPKTYAMEVYQFFKTDENGDLKPDSGEYILLTEEVIINTIKIPKNRAWYYNKDDKYLGTDILTPQKKHLN